MNTSESSAKIEIENLKEEIENVKNMSLEEMQETYNTDDSKEEFLQILEQELHCQESILNFYGDCEEEEEY